MTHLASVSMRLLKYRFLWIMLLRNAASLQNDAEVVICKSHSCRPSKLNKVSLTDIQSTAILIFDDSPCWHAAQLRLGYTLDFSKRSAGEINWCANTIRLFLLLGYDVYTTRYVRVAEALVTAGKAAHRPFIFVVYFGWHKILSPKRRQNAYLIRPPFQEQCLIMMDTWGASVPTSLWPGDLKHYLTVYPHKHNAYSGHMRPKECTLAQHSSLSDLPRFALVFGKFNVMPWKLKSILPFFKDEVIWLALRKRIHIVITDCSDALATTLKLGPNYKQHFSCWKDSALWSSLTYQELVIGAAFLLGLGTPCHSPTPVEALYCRTPVIMPPQQHRLIREFAEPREFYPVTSSAEVLSAVDTVLAECKPTLQPAGSGGAHKIDAACFSGPPSLEAVLADDVIAPRLEAFLKSRQSSCQNLTAAAKSGKLV